MHHYCDQKKITIISIIAASLFFVTSIALGIMFIQAYERADELLERTAALNKENLDMHSEVKSVEYALKNAKEDNEKLQNSIKAAESDLETAISDYDKLYEAYEEQVYLTDKYKQESLAWQKKYTNIGSDFSEIQNYFSDVTSMIATVKKLSSLYNGKIITIAGTVVGSSKDCILADSDAVCLISDTSDTLIRSNIKNSEYGYINMSMSEFPNVYVNSGDLVAVVAIVTVTNNSIEITAIGYDIILSYEERK